MRPYRLLVRTEQNPLLPVRRRQLCLVPPHPLQRRPHQDQRPCLGRLVRHLEHRQQLRSRLLLQASEQVPFLLHLLHLQHLHRVLPLQQFHSGPLLPVPLEAVPHLALVRRLQHQVLVCRRHSLPVLDPRQCSVLLLRQHLDQAFPRRIRAPLRSLGRPGHLAAVPRLRVDLARSRRPQGRHLEVILDRRALLLRMCLVDLRLRRSHLVQLLLLQVLEQAAIRIRALSKQDLLEASAHHLVAWAAQLPLVGHLAPVA
mmetsp:Transcript_9871/g.30157  ORF Transcript_9871/g.30157 Transcript_9871/m.30157 type:complete len:257 (+) Transcript_9871:1155-1925(+)